MLYKLGGGGKALEVGKGVSRPSFVFPPPGSFWSIYWNCAKKTARICFFQLDILISLLSPCEPVSRQKVSRLTKWVSNYFCAGKFPPLQHILFLSDTLNHIQLFENLSLSSFLQKIYTKNRNEMTPPPSPKNNQKARVFHTSPPRESHLQWFWQMEKFMKGFPWKSTRPQEIILSSSQLYITYKPEAKRR